MPFWSYQPPGEGWLDALAPFSWMQIRPLGIAYEAPEPTASPSAELPGGVGSAETCFREPDGWISCVLRGTIWEQQKRDRGLPEVSQDAPEFIPPVAVESTRYDPPPVVSSDSEAGVSEDEASVAIDWGTVFQGAVDIANNWGQQPVTNFMGPPAAPVSLPSGQILNGPMSSCGCNSNPCVCGTINGRPALVDPRTGKRCYRRRRRVMLTEGDFNTLLRIATLPNNANVRTALAKAIGRR